MKKVLSLGPKINPLSATLYNLNFHPLEVVSRCREPQLKAGEKFFVCIIWIEIYVHPAKIKGYARVYNHQKNRWFHFGLLIWPYDVSMSID